MINARACIQYRPYFDILLGSNGQTSNGAREPPGRVSRAQDEHTADGCASAWRFRRRASSVSEKELAWRPRRRGRASRCAHPSWKQGSGFPIRFPLFFFLRVSLTPGRMDERVGLTINTSWERHIFGVLGPSFSQWFTSFIEILKVHSVNMWIRRPLMSG